MIDWKKDLIDGLQNFRLWIFLGVEDIKQKYVRTLLGPWWVVITTVIWIMCMSIVMSSLFDEPITKFLPFITSGIIIWTFLVGVINEGSVYLIVSSEIIKSIRLPIIVHIMRCIVKHFVILLHNIPVLIIIMLFCGKTIGFNIILSILALGLIFLNSIWVVFVLAILNSRFRDVHQIIAAALSILPFITPIYWQKDMLKERAWIGDINPFYHAIEIFRASILNENIPYISWIVMVSTLFLGSIFIMYLYKKSHNKIIFWL
jgi:ABC-type polysaccharide/polyol phosphate export permease